MKLALGLYLGTCAHGCGGASGGTDPITAMVAAFIIRVLADGGTVEPTTCLTAFLTDLNNIA